MQFCPTASLIAHVRGKVGFLSTSLWQVQPIEEQLYQLQNSIMICIIYHLSSWFHMDYCGGNWKCTFSYSRMTCNQSNTIVELIYIDLQDGATTITGLLTILFQLTILLSFGQLAQLGQGGWASC